MWPSHRGRFAAGAGLRRANGGGTSVHTRWGFILADTQAPHPWGKRCSITSLQKPLNRDNSPQLRQLACDAVKRNQNQIAANDGRTPGVNWQLSVGCRHAAAGWMHSPSHCLRVSFRGAVPHRSRGGARSPSNSQGKLAYFRAAEGRVWGLGGSLGGLSDEWMAAPDRRGIW